MKTTNIFKTLLLALLMAAAGNGAMAQETEYHPFADNAVWSVNNIKYATYGDTTICGRNYLKVYRQEEDHPFDFDVEQAEYFCAIRNDTAAQRVYGIYKEPAIVYKYSSPDFPFFSVIDTVSDSTEFLLYDFRIGIDDTVVIASFEEHFNDISDPGIYVYEISLYHGENSQTITNLSDNSTRKALKVEILNWTHEELFEENLLEWVEGIGNMDGTFTVARTSLGFVWEGTTMWLLCYEQSDSVLLSRTWFDLDGNYDCFHHVGINDELIQDGNIYPNPTTGSLTLSLPESWANSNCHVIIYNTAGQQIFSKSFESALLEINLHGLPNALYILQVIGENRQIISKKIIKQ